MIQNLQRSGSYDVFPDTSTPQNPEKTPYHVDRHGNHRTIISQAASAQAIFTQQGAMAHPHYAIGTHGGASSNAGVSMADTCDTTSSQKNAGGFHETQAATQPFTALTKGMLNSFKRGVINTQILNQINHQLGQDNRAYDEFYHSFRRDALKMLPKINKGFIHLLTIELGKLPNLNDAQKYQIGKIFHQVSLKEDFMHSSITGKLTSRDLSQHAHFLNFSFADTPRNLTNKNVLLVGGGNTQNQAQLPQTHFHNVDLTLPSNSSEAAMVAQFHTRADFSQSALTVAEGNFHEIWALYSVPYYSDNIPSVANTYTNFLTNASSNSILRVYPIDMIKTKTASLIEPQILAFQKNIIQLINQSPSASTHIYKCDGYHQHGVNIHIQDKAAVPDLVQKIQTLACNIDV